MFKSTLQFILFLFISYNSLAQTDSASTSSNPQRLTLDDCIRYALQHQPAVRQSLIDESIARTNNAIALSTWMPQVTGTANYQHYFQLPVAFVPNANGTLTQVNSGLTNISIPGIAATQTLFSTDVLLAAKASRLTIHRAAETTVETKIDLVSNVSKAFYDLLLSTQQITVLKEDTARLIKNQQDAYHQYVSGIADKVDYKQATIALNNAMAQLKSATEAVGSKNAALKQLMGFPTDRYYTVVFDTTQMMQQVYADTLAPLEFEKRIEYQLLLTQKRLQQETTMYYKLGFIPTVSAYYNYNHEFESNNFSDLYDKAYPNSYWGIQLNVPVFQGFRRLENIHKARLQEIRTDWDLVNLRSGIYTEYREALAGYKSNLYNLKEQGENVQIAREVYDIVKLQYREGIKAYLNVITAETDLRTSEINYLNALFQLLSTKIDLQKAMGDIAPDR